MWFYFIILYLNMLLFFVRCGPTITAWASLKHTYLSCWEFDEKYQTTLPVFALSVEHKYKKQVETVSLVLSKLNSSCFVCFGCCELITQMLYIFINTKSQSRWLADFLKNFGDLNFCSQASCFLTCLQLDLWSQESVLTGYKL